MGPVSKQSRDRIIMSAKFTIFLRDCCEIHEWSMNEKKKRNRRAYNNGKIPQSVLWSWGCAFHEQGSWTKGILTEQRKLDRPMLFLLATKRAWSAPGAKVKFVYERVMSRLWVLHERLHLEVNQTKKKIYIYIYTLDNSSWILQTCFALCLCESHWSLWKVYENV